LCPFPDLEHVAKMNFSLAHQLSRWRERLAAILAALRATRLSRGGRDAAVAALAALLTDMQSMPAPCMDPELELGQ
jgi:hypothetical protein